MNSDLDDKFFRYYYLVRWVLEFGAEFDLWSSNATFRAQDVLRRKYYLEKTQW